MKRLFLILTALIVMLGLLTGCSNEDPTPTIPSEPAQTGQISEPEPTVPVDEDVFYYSNDLEYGRLYAQRLDGTDPRLIADAYCYDVQQDGACVYFLDNRNLCVYHIPTGKISVLVENTFDYAVDGNDLVYYLDGEEYFQTEIHYRNLETGEDTLIEEIMDGSGMAISDGILYYIKYEQLYGKSLLTVCDLNTFEKKTIANELSSFHNLRVADGGVYFEGMSEDYTFAQYYVSAGANDVRKVDEHLTDNCQMFHVSDDGIFCIYTYYFETGTRSCVHRHNADGTVTELTGMTDEGYYTVQPVKDDVWLLQHTYYGGWKPVDAQGDEENFVFQYAYYLLDSAGNVTPIDVAGEIGSMFASGDYPVMDSSTARKPVAAEIYSLFVANYGYEGAKPLCSTTHGAWLNIADRTADIALLAAPTEEEMAYLNERGVSIEMKLYGGDGLVFIGNAANPVQDLSHEQLIAIYQGKITNWSEVGGPDQPITVYYRDDQSGSQRLFEKMVFKGLELPDYEKLGFERTDEMSTIVEIVMADPYSIGYSIMTYLSDVYENEELKPFAVDGVVPSVDTVKDSTYRYHTQGYVVIRSDEPADSPARRLYDWFGSSVCDEILIANGITPLHGDNGIG